MTDLLCFTRHEITRHKWVTLLHTKIREEPNETDPNGLSQITTVFCFHSWLGSFNNVLDLASTLES